MEDNFNADYDALAVTLLAFAERLESLVQDLLLAEGIRTHSVICRVKSKASCVRKLQKSGGERQLSSLTDILGIRIITYFQDEVDAAAQVIEHEFLIDSANSVNKSAALAPDRFGYRSLHYVCQMSGSRSGLPEYRDYGKILFEIQIRSILQHAWAEIEHDLGYKSEAAVPKAVRRRFSRLAGLLELGDEEFVGIRDELALHQADSTETIGSGDLNVDIDQDSLYSFVETSRQIEALDIEVARAMKRPMPDEIMRGFIGKQVEQLTSVGFHTIAEISDFLRSQNKLIIACAEEWARAIGAPGDGVALSRGVTLVYIFIVQKGRQDLADEATDDDDSGRKVRSAYAKLVRGATARIG
jgi:putative GTP pyrophosphokinase